MGPATLTSCACGMKTISVQLFRTPALVNWRKIAITLVDPSGGVLSGKRHSGVTVSARGPKPISFLSQYCRRLSTSRQND